MQSYLIKDDLSGNLVALRLARAADRGVRVRLLLDDLGVGAADDEGFLLLDSHPNVSIHLFNPIALRGARTLRALWTRRDAAASPVAPSAATPSPTPSPTPRAARRGTQREPLTRARAELRCLAPPSTWPKP